MARIAVDLSRGITGTYTLWVGGHQPVNVTNAALPDGTGLVEATFTITGTPTNVTSCPELRRQCYACL